MPNHNAIMVRHYVRGSEAYYVLSQNTDYIRYDFCKTKLFDTWFIYQKNICMEYQNLFACSIFATFRCSYSLSTKHAYCKKEIKKSRRSNKRHSNNNIIIVDSLYLFIIIVVHFSMISQINRLSYILFLLLTPSCQFSILVIYIVK